MPTRTNKKYPEGFVICSVTGAKIPYNGYGRPPKYAPGVRKQRESERGKQKRAAKRLAAA